MADILRLFVADPLYFIMSQWFFFQYFGTKAKVPRIKKSTKQEILEISCFNLSFRLERSV